MRYVPVQGSEISHFSCRFEVQERRKRPYQIKLLRPLGSRLVRHPRGAKCDHGLLRLETAPGNQPAKEERQRAVLYVQPAVFSVVLKTQTVRGACEATVSRKGTAGSLYMSTDVLNARPWMLRSYRRPRALFQETSPRLQSGAPARTKPPSTAISSNHKPFTYYM